uniref:Uncharacterized protein n=1 Tax=Picea sitchensis TaxID=3332 RepID=A0A6B9XVZ3_PICSI|nr:hypothetical protein Q903MT_gene5459 [Picea sitchensis]
MAYIQERRVWHAHESFTMGYKGRRPAKEPTTGKILHGGWVNIYSPPLRELLMELGPMSDRIINQIPEPFSCLSLHGMGQYSGKETILLYRKIVCATSEGNKMVLNREVVLSIEMKWGNMFRYPSGRLTN